MIGPDRDAWLRRVLVFDPVLSSNAPQKEIFEICLFALLSFRVELDLSNVHVMRARFSRNGTPFSIVAQRKQLSIYEVPYLFNGRLVTDVKVRGSQHKAREVCDALATDMKRIAVTDFLSLLTGWRNCNPAEAFPPLSLSPLSLQQCALPSSSAQNRSLSS